MADPVSSVTYAIESSLHALDGDLASLFLTMVAIIAIIAVIAVTYHELIGSYPHGGGGAAASAESFGEGTAFIPLGALLVDFTLTVAVSAAAGASALIAYAPGLESVRTPLALLLACLVAGIVLLGHRGRVVLAAATLLFIAFAAIVVVAALGTSPGEGGGGSAGGGTPLLADARLGAVLLAIPLGMALATGVESPSDSIAQLPELEDPDRIRFGRGTLWLMVVIVGSLTIGLAGAAVHLGTGLPPANSTLLAEVARKAVGGGALFAGFQAASALLLLSAAASAYLAGSGVLKALATLGGGDQGLVPSRFGETNRFLVPPLGVALVLVIALILVAAAGGFEQHLVDYYAVAVFASFLAATLGCARLSHRDGRRLALVFNLLGAILSAYILVVNVTRIQGLIALLTALAVAGYLRLMWVRRGRPSGVAGASAA